ncbi:putative nucleotidyltransferase substrate binding domain-containing protein [Paracoccus spongiarum]|uniref:Nucleotidyltransferase substrate binding domain-containing protein n=1 Tax=Paracoccus spongiarum TaxID=3064387 RepID=A0ABT9JC12_9RHOB|nr:putative nucleotidyltransferase substrate binding domain-containing protein [Paracoccus sp. 2205BS29-5]MDP5307219.1 putative nucleotidyltransferase substrate binding domain-containing protein [Paracoccus sp. 2205BS29-5]
MWETADFIATVHPYDSLPRDELARVAASFSRRAYAAGAEVYHVGDLLPGLYLIESGRIRVTDRNGDSVSELGPRNSFGERGLLRDGAAVTSAVACEDAVVLMLPAEEVRRLIQAHRPVARFFDRGRGPADRGTDIALLKVGELLTRRPLSCPPDTPIIEAARMMREARVSSIGVTEGDRLTGLVTIRDMSNRVVAEGRDLRGPVRAVMTHDPITLPASALGYDVLNVMLERRVGHLPVVEDGRFVGMVSQTDLTRVQAITASALIREVAMADSVAALARTTARIPDLLARLVTAHQRHEVVTGMITDIADAVTRRLLAMAADRLGPAPAPWLWAACGSQGRQEQTGVSDQDNCLILAEGADPADPWFADLARQVSDGLHACGYVYCPGDMMATNPRWRQPREVWRGYFRDWIEHPSPEAQMLASVMFDLRAIGGEAALLADLQRETLGMAGKNSIFVAHMIANSLKHRPPLGLIGGFATIRAGEHRHHIDMKHNGVVPVTDLARVYALQGGIAAVNTRARLEDAEAAGVISASGARDLLAAYDLIQTMRLDNQAHLIRAGRKPDNYLSPSDLPDFERSHLRDAFVVVRGMQSAVGHGKGML